MIARRLLVSGRVQGVGFRAFVAEAARRHAVCGWVRNLGDGRVEVQAEGEPAAVEALVAACASGPLLARVDAVADAASEIEGCRGFRLMADG